MSDEKKKKNEEDIKKRNPTIITEGIDFNYCQIHHEKIPKGGECSQCKKEKIKSIEGSTN